VNTSFAEDVVIILAEVDGWIVDVAKRILVKLRRDTPKVSVVELYRKPKKILRGSEGSQLTANV
jgi:hypothetical protein